MMAEILKHVYNTAYIDKISLVLQSIHPSFPAQTFKQTVFADGWDELELKQRMRHITVCLRKTLPDSYDNAVDILKKTIPSLGGHELENMIFPDFVEVYGLDNWDVSIPALELFTQYGSSEFAVRPFIIADTNRMMSQMQKWAHSSNHHVRRLSSEGCRPRLPWAMALPAFKRDPAPIVPILEKLKSDESEYVRRSVANNLNDIAKDHPNLVLGIADRWLGSDTRTDWIVKHGCRTLLKKGVPEALALFGFIPERLAEVTGLAISPDAVLIGTSSTISFAMLPIGEQSCRLRIEYGIDFVKANGARNRKLFKITENTYEPGSSVAFTRNHSFREMTTRKHYPGRHALTIIVNGQESAQIEFDLLPNCSIQPKSPPA